MSPETELKDPLTGLYSRASLDDRLQQELDRACRYEQPFALLLLDLDHFKSVNDAFGHARGDQVLVELTQRIRTVTRKADVPFRYGGDEFVLLLPHTNIHQATTLAERLLEGIRSTPFPGEPPVAVTLSIGVAGYPSDGQTPAGLLEITDRRHYQAKRSGRNCVITADPPQPSALKLAEPARLLERDEALAALHRFLDTLRAQQRGMLRVAGPPGSGRSRFLTEAAKAARLRGLAVLALHAAPALKRRRFGVVANAIADPSQEWWDLPRPSPRTATFVTALRQSLADKDYAGLLIAIDDFAHLDRGTLALLNELVFTADLPQLAIAYTTDDASAARSLRLDAPLQATIPLQPLSPDGLQIWLRHSLQWEAPQAFLDWFYEQTAGFPSRIHHGLSCLIAQDILAPVANGWTWHQDVGLLCLAACRNLVPARPPNNLADDLPDFVGREDDLQTVKALLQEHRLLTVIGPDGSGKTRLAIQAAAERLEHYPDGVCFVPLAALSSAEYLVATIAEALQLALAGSQELKAQLFHHLRARQVLLVLDNFEHLRSGAALLNELIDQTPGVNLLVTCREALHLPGEKLFALGGLPVAASAQVDEAESYSAVQLFLHRAHPERVAFELAPEDRAEVARLCRLLAGMPLGIELAAAWIPTYTPQEIAAKIENNLGFLSADQPELPNHRRPLAALLEAIWTALSESERAQLRRLSVFRGGFTLEAARAVVGASPFFLDALVAKSYLRRTPEGRLEIHESLRQYAADQLRALPQEQTIAQGEHCEYYAALLQRQASSLLSEKQTLALLRTEIGNIRAAWRWAVAQARYKEIARCTQALGRYYELSGLCQEGARAFGRAVDRVRALVQECDSSDPDGQLILGRLLATGASLLNAQGSYNRALAVAREAVDLARACEAVELEAAGQLQWGQALMMRAEYAAARWQFECTLNLARTSQSRQLEADGLQRLSTVCLHQGDAAAARAAGEQALQLYRDLNDRRAQGAALAHLGRIALLQGEHAPAQVSFEQALTLHRELDDRLGTVVALNQLGEVFMAQGDYARAQALYEQARRSSHEIGACQQAGTALYQLGNVSSKLGAYAAARRYLEQALGECRENGQRGIEGQTLSDLGSILHLLGDDAAAQEYCQQALRIAQDSGSLHDQSRAWSAIGHTLMGQGQLAEAAAAYQQALDIRCKLDQTTLVAGPLAGLAEVCLANRDQSQAQALVDQILSCLESSPPNGLDELARVQLTCYRVLQANDDPRARHVLSQARSLLLEQAAKIPNEALRRSFLEIVPAHREILRAASTKNHTAPDPAPLAAGPR